MAFFERTEQEIVAQSMSALTQQTNITQLSRGGIARFLLDTVAKEQAIQHNIFDSGLMQMFIRYASGRYLDVLGDMLNLPRTEATHAYDDTNNFMFYVTSGTFGDINTGSNITIPANTTVSTVQYSGNLITPGLETQPVIQYVTTQSIVCESNQSFAYVPVRATIEGKGADVPRDVLKKHDFVSYSGASANSLKCTNRFAISNGEDRESEDSYRFRLANVFRARNMAVYASVRLAALSVPGVSDIKDVMCEQGPGTFSIYIKSSTPTVGPKLLNEVSAVVSSVTAYGIRPFILAPNPIGLEFVVGVNWSPRATKAQKTDGYTAMRNALENRLNYTNIGESIDFSELVDIAIQSSQYVNSIGIGRPNKFEQVYSYRVNGYGDNAVRSLVIGDTIEPLYNERVILETSGKYRGIQFIT